MSEPTREDLWQAARNELQARLDARDATIEELEAENRMLQANYDVVIAAMQQAEAENRQLREALREYADKRSWDRGEHGRLNVFNRDTNGPFIAFTAIAFAAIRGGGGENG